MMRKLLLGLAAFMFIFTSCGRKTDTVKIGFIGPLTGDYANYGIMMSDAVRIAVEEKNASGGIDGKKVVLIAEDSEGRIEKANSAIEKLSSIDRILGLVGGVFSSESLAIAPRANAEKIVMCSPSATHKAVTSRGEFVFRNVLSDELQAIVFAKYARNVLKLDRVAVLYIVNDYSQGLAEDFKKEFESLGGRIVAFETGSPQDRDFKTQLTRIRNSNAEALYIPNYVAEMAQMLDQKAQLGINMRVLSADGFSNPEIFELSGDNALNVLFSNSTEDTSQSTAKADFIKKYTEKYKIAPDAFSLNAYDIAVLLINAIETVYMESSDSDKKTLKLDRNRIREVFHSTADYNGVSGNITFLPNGDASKNVGIFLSEKKNGEYVFTQTGAYKIVDGELIEIK